LLRAVQSADRVSYEAPSRQIKRHPGFKAIHKRIEDAETDVSAWLVEYDSRQPDYTGGIFVEVYDPNGNLMWDANVGSKSENLRSHLADAVEDWKADPDGKFASSRRSRDKRALADVARTIIEQMGGWGPMRAMLGVKAVDDLGGKGLGFKWPNKQRSRGNYVEIKITGLDLYDMTFFNATRSGKKQVAQFKGLYADMLAPTFVKQTGWNLRLF
jgi:hypothetical protein